MSNLSELLERVEKATGPDRVLDAHRMGAAGSRVQEIVGPG